MSVIDSRTLADAEQYLRSVDARFDPLTADSGWMIQRVKDWTESRGLGRNDHDASDIVIHVVQRAGRNARTLDVKTGDPVTVNGKGYLVGLLPWRKAEHRAVLELIVPGGRDDRRPTP
jgi:hypothetical protein